MKENEYLPHVRDILKPSKKELKISHKNYSANPVTDDIVVNNIASQEFDYISPDDDGDAH